MTCNNYDLLQGGRNVFFILGRFSPHSTTLNMSSEGTIALSDVFDVLKGISTKVPSDQLADFPKACATFDRIFQCRNSSQVTVSPGKRRRNNPEIEVALLLLLLLLQDHHFISIELRSRHNEVRIKDAIRR